MNNSINGAPVSPGKKQKTGRFNLIDLVLILIVIVVIAAVIYILDPFSWIQNMTAKQSRTIQYTVELLGVDETFLDKIQENDVVVDSVSKNGMGTVTAVDYNTKYSELQYVQQQGVLVEYPNRYNVIITISATADYIEDEGYSVNSSRVAVGEKLTLRFPNYVAEGYCIGLEPA